MNANVRYETSNTGKHGCCVMNNNCERLVDFCLNNNYVTHKTSTSLHEHHLMVEQATRLTKLSLVANGVGSFKM